MPRKTLWTTFEEWSNYGLQERYNHYQPAYFPMSKNKMERSWYNRGKDMKWTNQFDFKRKFKKVPWKAEEEWKKFGLERGYDKKNPISLKNSRDKTERSWYNKGNSVKWLKNFTFDFARNDRHPYKDLESWINFGIRQGYEKISPTKLARSKNKTRRSWYSKGNDEGWIKRFNFNRLRIAKNTWKDLSFALDQTVKAMQSEGWDRLPNMHRLSKSGYSTLADIICKYHGGYSIFREKLREYLGAPSGNQQLEEFLEAYVA